MLHKALFESVRVMDKRVTKGKNGNAGQKMVRVAWLGGDHMFFGDAVHDCVQEGDTVTISGEARFNDGRLYVDVDSVRGGTLSNYQKGASNREFESFADAPAERPKGRPRPASKAA